jgi:hypothetical protein
MTNFIALKDDDGFLSSFTRGSNGSFANPEGFDINRGISTPIAFRGITKKDLITTCWNLGRTFYFMDTGYFANYSTISNPKAVKRWHRIVKNNVQHLDPVEDRPSDRWERLQKEFPRLSWPGWKKNGKAILVVTPSEKPCKFYGIDSASWAENTVNTLKQYTDRPIIVRTKAKLRIDRSLRNTIYDQFDNDNIFALVTYNSIAATEAVAYGIPSFTLAPNAASSMCLSDLSKIETPYYPHPEEVRKWCCYLSYGQFNNEELADGTAWRIFSEYN